MVGSVDGVMTSLVIIDAAGDLVEEEDNFVFGGLSLHVGLDGTQQHLAEGILIDLGQDGVGVLVVVVNVGSGQSSEKGDDKNLWHY